MPRYIIEKEKRPIDLPTKTDKAKHIRGIQTQNTQKRNIDHLGAPKQMTNRMIRFTGLREQCFQLRVFGLCVVVRRSRESYRREGSYRGLMGLAAKQFLLR